MDTFIIHACEQVLRFSQVEKWDDLSEELKVQLGFNMGVVAHGLQLSKEDGFMALSQVRQGVTPVHLFREHIKSLVLSHGVKVDEVNIARPF